MAARWLIVLITAVVLVGTPIAVGARHAADSDVSAPELAARIQASAALGLGRIGADHRHAGDPGE